jgi:rhamnogalacturonyl hydrolase YesR
MNTTEMTQAANAQRVLLTLHCDRIDNTGDLQFYCYGLTGDDDKWDAQTITMNNYQEQLGGEISNDGVSSVGELLGTVDATGWSSDFDVQFDVTDFVTDNAAYGISFLVTASTCAGYFNSCETDEEEKKPKLVISSEGVPVTVNRVTDDGEVISTSVVNAVEGERYEYNVLDSIVIYNESIYVFDEENSTLVTEEVNYGDVIEVVYKKAQNVEVDNVDVVTYVGKAPSLPKTVSVTADGVTALMSVDWDSVDSSLYAEKGSFTHQGVITNSNVSASASVRVFPEYRSSVGGDLTINIYVDGELKESKAVSAAYGSTFTLSSSYERYNSIYILDSIEGEVSELGQSVVMDSLDQVIDLYYVSNETVEGSISAKIKADNLEDNSYSLVVNTEILNTEENDAKVLLIIATYDESGEVKSCNIEEAVAQAGLYESVNFTTKLPYDVNGSGNTVIYLWRDSLEPLCDVLNTSTLEVEDFLPEEVYDMMPTYDSAVATLRKANDYWQSTYAYNSQPNGLDKSFWDSAAYHTGNMEAYKLLGDEDYLEYSVNWANACNWKGNNYTGDKSTWTWGYNQSQGSNAVLFGDWQICFQTFIDLYNLNLTDDSGNRIGDLSRVYEVMEYQVSTDVDAYWWWADALYMVMPVLSKMYVLTDDEVYLDKLYQYFKYAKELMYDGPGGIPSSADGYTTSAKLSNGASYTDPDNYAYLFFRDAGYVYPLKPNSGHETEKNFWARGDGWVFAGLAKVLSDMPEDYEHYDEFYNTYMEMAKAIIDCQTVDSEGRGFWTQSMLQNYPKGTNGNDYGYETSGTAFFTYGLFWGINNGLLDEETYLEAAVRAWGYLENVALQSNGKVGYVQQIGSNATQATPASQTQNFGVGAFLLASCEAARWGEKNN